MQHSPTVMYRKPENRQPFGTQLRLHAYFGLCSARNPAPYPITDFMWLMLLEDGAKTGRKFGVASLGHTVCDSLTSV